MVTRSNGRSGRRRRSRRAGKKVSDAFRKKTLKVVRANSKSMALKAAPLLRQVKDWKPADGQIQATFYLSTEQLFQAPFQDLPVQLAPTKPGEAQRTSAVIYPQFLKLRALLQAASPAYNGLEGGQYFRVVVFRYPGEMDFAIDNGAVVVSNKPYGWMKSATQTAHMVYPFEDWRNKPFIKNQIQVLADRTYFINDAAKLSADVNMTVPIRKKLTFEQISGGAAAVG